MQKLSVVTVTKNEEAKIGMCLESVKWAAEIIIIDSYSTDATVDICSKYTSKVIHREWPGYASQKNFGIDKASGDWILILDADEQVSDELREEIQALLQENSAADGYHIPFKNYLGKRWLKHGGLYPDLHLRLFKKGKARYGNKEIHETLEFDGAAGVLSGAIIHYTYDDFADYLNKVNRYTTLEANFLSQQGYKVKWLDLIKPIGKFFQLYIFKFGYKDGLSGLVNAVFLAVYMFIKYVKVLELLRK